MLIDDKGLDPNTIADYIVSRNILDKKSLSDALDSFLLKRIETGSVFYSLVNYGQTIELRDETGNFQRGIEIPLNPEKNIDWIPYSSNSILVLDDNNSNFKEIIDRGKQSGLASGNKGGFLRLGDSGYLINQWLFELVSKASTKCLPLDLYIPEKQTKFILVSDRGSGKVYLISSDLKKIINEIKVRQTDTRKAINPAYSVKGRKFFITDNQTPDIVVLNADNNKVERFYQDYGPLGNMIPGKNDENLYIVSCDYDKPAALLLVSESNFKLIKKIPLEGKLFSEVDDPTDLIAISPDKKSVYVMTYIDKPSLFTPLISVISTETNEVTQKIRLDSDEKPVGISFRIKMSLPETRLSFSDFLIEKKLMHESTMQRVVSDLTTQKEIKHDFDQIQLLDQDVSELRVQIETELGVQEKEIADLIQPDEKDIEMLLKETGLDWAGRKMSKEDKETLIKKLAVMNNDPEVSKTNSVFVLSWMKDILNP